MRKRAFVSGLFASAGFLLFSGSAASSDLQGGPPAASLEGLTSALLGGGDGAASIADQRHARLQSLISTDPAEVIRLAVEPQTRLSLPDPIRGLVEEAVDLEGTLDVLVEDSAASSRTLYFLSSNGQRYQLFFASRPPELQSGRSARVRGVRVDQSIAVDPASGNLKAGGASPSSAQAVSALPNTFGAQRTVVLLVNFSNSPTQPYTVASAKSVVFTSVSSFDLENSYGQTWLTGDVFGWFTIPVSSGVCDYTAIQTSARSAATAAGVNLANYTHQVYAFPENACSWWGLGSVGGSPSSAWINGDFQLQVVAHEMGHNLGLYHAHSLDCGTVVLGTTCTMSEYGDTVDTMAYAQYHFSAFQKERLGWLGYGSSPALTTVASSGTYSIDAYEPQGGASKALKIPRGTTGSYFYVEARKGLGFDAGLGGNGNVANGVVVHLASPSDGNSSDLLDMTPGTISFNDPALGVGQTFTDPTSGVGITVNSVASSGASVSVSLGAAPPPAVCTHVAPSLSLVPAQASGVKAGTAVSFTLSLVNNDVSPCASSGFSLGSSVPSGWKGALSKSSLTVAPGAGASATLTVTSATTAANGSYTIGATGINSAATSISGAASAVYVVNDPTAGGSGGTLSDAFSRPDSSTLGSGWIVATGAFGIVSGEARNTAGAGDSMAVVAGLTGTSETVAADFASTDNGKTPQLGLVLRYKDAKNYYFLYRNISGGGGRKVRISKVVNGSETVLANVSDSNPAENTFFHLVAKANGTTLTLEMNGAVVATASDATFSTGLVGIRMVSSAASNRADNFTATAQ